MTKPSAVEICEADLTFIRALAAERRLTFDEAFQFVVATGVRALRGKRIR